jgi:hypothetical protein
MNWQIRRDPAGVSGYHVCHPDDIIASKRAARRAKDIESLPRLESFREFWKRTHG